jgi:hypothetical protein
MDFLEDFGKKTFTKFKDKKCQKFSIQNVWIKLNFLEYLRQNVNVNKTKSAL